MTCNIQSECFISKMSRCSTQKFICHFSLSTYLHHKMFYHVGLKKCVLQILFYDWETSGAT